LLSQHCNLIGKEANQDRQEIQMDAIIVGQRQVPPAGAKNRKERLKTIRRRLEW
jgi:hypothetical protein